jgi:hypothetical protein
MAHPVIEGFRKEWPAAFAGPSLDKLSGNAFRWSTTQNRRCRGEIPAGCFIEGRPTLVLRDPFLDWANAWLTNRATGSIVPRDISGGQDTPESKRGPLLGAAPFENLANTANGDHSSSRELALPQSQRLAGQGRTPWSSQ